MFYRWCHSYGNCFAFWINYDKKIKISENIRNNNCEDLKINLSLCKCSNASLTISINELETKEEEKTKRKIITEYQGQV